MSLKKNQSQIRGKTQNGQENAGETVNPYRLTRPENAERVVATTVLGT